MLLLTEFRLKRRLSDKEMFVSRTTRIAEAVKREINSENAAELRSNI